ncbi:DUF167 domain-containing protein [Kordiimonas aquimaris]|uniref:DUF167 domain-containing protein n=1 Tax=Kordiimonas aquimaris TaxID=707591 RepID=UPI0021D11DA1|nr:DUF167 family protein [Kordiimonas aquimaris]
MATKDPHHELPVERAEDGVKTHVHLTPNAAHTKIDRIDKGADHHPRLRSTVVTPPEKGKANKALITLLAKKLRLPKSTIQIIAGHQSRDKIIFISGEADILLPRVEQMIMSLD